MLRMSVIAVCLLSAGVATASEGLAVEPGLWEMTSTVQMPMLPQPQVNTTQECFDKSVISMEELQASDMDPKCTFESEQIEEQTVKWVFDCPMEGGTSHGEWQATSHGDRIEGSGTIDMNMQGQAMQMTLTWAGRRVGACP